MNYNPEGSDTDIKDIHKIYSYIHFQSMPDKNAVIWLNSKETMLQALTNILVKNEYDLQATNSWYKKIVSHPVDKASQRIVDVLKTIKGF